MDGLFGLLSAEKSSKCEFQIHICESGLHTGYILRNPVSYSMLRIGTTRMKVTLFSSLLAVLFAVSFVPAAFATPTAQIVCSTTVSPSNCPNASAGGAGKSINIYTTLSWTGETPSSFAVTACYSSNFPLACTGTSQANGPTTWGFSVSPTSVPVATATGSAGIVLTVTAPTTVTSTDDQQSFTIVAIDGAHSLTIQAAASLTVAASVPQFGLGMGLAIAIGLVGFVLLRKTTLHLPTPGITSY